MRYYEVARKTMNDENLIKFLEDFKVVKEYGTEEDKKLFSGLYKHIICQIRKKNNIKNVMSLGVHINPETKEKFVGIILFDYELPDHDWNAWGTVEFDEENEKTYFEV